MKRKREEEVLAPLYGDGKQQKNTNCSTYGRPAQKVALVTQPRNMLGSSVASSSSSSKGVENKSLVCGAETESGVFCQELRSRAIQREGNYECPKCATILAAQMVVPIGGGYDVQAWRITDLNGRLIPASSGTMSILGSSTDALDKGSRGSSIGEEDDDDDPEGEHFVDSQVFREKDEADEEEREDGEDEKAREEDEEEEETGDMDGPLVEWTGTLGAGIVTMDSGEDSLQPYSKQDVPAFWSGPYKGSKADAGIQNTFSDHVAVLELPRSVTTTCVDIWRTLRTEYGFQRIPAAAGLEAAVLELASLRCGHPRLRSMLMRQTGSSEKSVSLAIQRLVKNKFPLDYALAPVAFGLAQLFLSDWAGEKLVWPIPSSSATLRQYVLLNSVRRWCERFYQDANRSILHLANQGLGLKKEEKKAGQEKTMPVKMDIQESKSVSNNSKATLHSMADRNREKYDLTAAATCILAASIDTSIDKLGMHELSETFIISKTDVSLKLLSACLEQLKLAFPSLGDYKRKHHRKPQTLFAMSAIPVDEDL